MPGALPCGQENAHPHVTGNQFTRNFPWEICNCRQPGTRMRNVPKWKNAAAVILIVLGCLVTAAAVAIVWLNQVVVDTDKYVETVAPLSEDPAIKDAVARSATDQLFELANAEQLTREVLPDRAGFLAAPIVEATKAFVQEQIRKELDSPRFVNIWTEANREAHDLVLQVVLGKEGRSPPAAARSASTLANFSIVSNRS